MIETMLQHDPHDRPCVDQLLRLPYMKPHFFRYKQMILSLIVEGKRQRRSSISVSARVKSILTAF